MPCLIPQKYIPWLFLLVLVLFNWPPIIAVTACLLGYSQHMLLKRNIIRLPLKVYRRIDSFVPDSWKGIGYIKVSSVEEELRKVCQDTCCSCLSCCCVCFSDKEEDGASAGLNPAKAMNDRVEIIGGGVAIGGSS